MNENENKTNAPIKLLPCPFCGGEASMSNVGSPSGGDRYVWIVGCNNEECDVQFPGYARKVDAAKVWNTRNEADALRTVAIAMRDALATCDPDQFGIGGGKHEGDTAWYIRDELIARADTAIKPNAAVGETGEQNGK